MRILFTGKYNFGHFEVIMNKENFLNLQKLKENYEKKDSVNDASYTES